MQDGDCESHCMAGATPVLAAAPSVKPSHDQLVAEGPFAAKHKYRPALPEVPVLEFYGAPPTSELVCDCGSVSQQLLGAPNITIDYAGVSIATNNSTMEDQLQSVLPSTCISAKTSCDIIGYCSFALEAPLSGWWPARPVSLGGIQRSLHGRLIRLVNDG